MILGIGTDLANIDRIAGVLERHGDRFRNRVFTETELTRAARRMHEAATLAKRWAAKEACSKALGTGLAMGIAWKDMAVSNLRSGQPTMQLTGWAAERLANGLLRGDPSGARGRREVPLGRMQQAVQQSRGAGEAVGQAGDLDDVHPDPDHGAVGPGREGAAGVTGGGAGAAHAPSIASGAVTMPAPVTPR